MGDCCGVLLFARVYCACVVSCVILLRGCVFSILCGVAFFCMLLIVLLLYILCCVMIILVYVSRLFICYRLRIVCVFALWWVCFY